jgi:oxygen-independent coproporphyrinogen-3 oxidase
MDINLHIKEEEVRSGIYIHFPYCIRKCDYCDFFSHPLSTGSVPLSGAVSSDFLKSYKGALIREMRYRSQNHPHIREYSSIYFGGGTPSLMPVDLIHEILDQIKSMFPVSDDCEITLEGNPENFTAEYLQALRKIGINRIHTGIQSFDEKNLKSVNRFYKKERYDSILNNLVSSGIESKGVDLIYGFPGQDIDNFFEDLEKVCHSGIDHISLYSLTAEMGTKFNEKIMSGRISPPDDDMQIQVMQILPEYMAKKDFHGYEVSNFSKLGSESRHNLSYWLYRPYLGFGPSAHGFDGKIRYGNSGRLEQYLVNPTQAEYQMHDPMLEFPLGFLRIRRPFSADKFIQRMKDFSMNENNSELEAKLWKIFRNWKSEGYGKLEERPEGTIFQWNPDGILSLDSRILEMVHGIDDQ